MNEWWNSTKAGTLKNHQEMPKMVKGWRAPPRGRIIEKNGMSACAFDSGKALDTILNLWMVVPCIQKCHVMCCPLNLTWRAIIGSKCWYNIIKNNEQSLLCDMVKEKANKVNQNYVFQDAVFFKELHLWVFLIFNSLLTLIVCILKTGDFSTFIFFPYSSTSCKIGT